HVQQSTVANFSADRCTLTLWLRVNPGWPGNATAYLFHYDGGNVSTQFFARNPTNLEIGFGTSTTGPTGIQLHDSNWHHLALVLTPTAPTQYQVTIFLDGKPSAPQTLTHSAADVLRAHQGLIIGSNNAHDPNAQFVGWMSEW